MTDEDARLHWLGSRFFVGGWSWSRDVHCDFDAGCRDGDVAGRIDEGEHEWRAGCDSVRDWGERRAYDPGVFAVASGDGPGGDRWGVDSAGCMSPLFQKRKRRSLEFR